MLKIQDVITSRWNAWSGDYGQCVVIDSDKGFGYNHGVIGPRRMEDKIVGRGIFKVLSVQTVSRTFYTQNGNH